LTCLKNSIESPDGAESEDVSKKKPKARNTERLTLAPLKFEDAVTAMLATQPPTS
jgi:hypothetical protein